MIPDWRNAHLDVMDTRDDTASEPAAPAVARRDGPDWGHLPHGNLTNQIIGAGFEAHNVLGAGFLEAVYANALTVELRHRGVSVDRNVAFAVVYRGCSVGRYVADLVVDQKVNFRDQSGQSHPPGTPRTGVELPARVGPGSGPRHELRQLGTVQARRRVAGSGPTGNKGRAEKRRRQNNGKT